MKNKFDKGQKLERKLHGVWAAMKRRCYNPNSFCYERYGGRGIEVCQEWHIYNNFKDWAIKNGYDEGLTLDRINNDGDYCPQNCQWVTQKVNNSHKSNTKRAYFEGKLMTFIEISEKTGIKIKTLYERNRKGVDLTKPLQEKISIILNGEKIYLTDLAKKLKIDVKVLYARYERGYTPEEIAKPLRQNINIGE